MNSNIASGVFCSLDVPRIFNSLIWIAQRLARELNGVARVVSIYWILRQFLTRRESHPAACSCGWLLFCFDGRLALEPDQLAAISFRHPLRLRWRELLRNVIFNNLSHNRLPCALYQDVSCSQNFHIYKPSAFCGGPLALQRT